MHRSSSGLIRLMWLSLAALAVGLGTPACGSSEPPRHVRAERVTAVPSDIMFYPHVLYGGDAAYLVEGKWYRPGVDSWVVFTQEPLELEMLRHTIEPRRATLLGL